MIGRRAILRGIAVGSGGALYCTGQSGAPAGVPDLLRVRGAELSVTFSGAPLDCPKPELLAWVSNAAGAVAGYFGAFPVSRAAIQVIGRAGRHGVLNGRTWGAGGARTRVMVGSQATLAELKSDWTLTHEFVHYGFPDMPERHHWIEEGIATYVEPIARVNAGIFDAATAWFEMVRDMPKGQPQPGDAGLDNTHTWGRTYWGGAIFCLVADVTIRKNTNNAKGLRDALRGIVRAGGTIEVEWPIERALEAGDRVTGGTTLLSLYRQMRDKAEPVDLAALWQELGVMRRGTTVIFDDAAPLAAIRKAILS